MNLGEDHLPPSSYRQSALVVVTPFSLRFLQVLFLSETRLVAAGYDNVPFLFGLNDSGSWCLLKNLDEPKASSAEKSGSTFSSAFEKFKGQGAPTDSLEPLKPPATVHENCIT